MATKKAAKAPSATKDERLAEADHLLRLIEEKEMECQLARSSAEIRREEYKTAKASYGERVEELRRLCRARKEKHPLLDAAANAGEKASTEAKGKPAAKDGWRGQDLSVLMLPPKMERAIRKAAIMTLGGLTDWMTGRGDFWSEDIEGLGPKAREAVPDAFTRFWDRHPEFCGNAEPATNAEEPATNAEEPATATAGEATD